MDSLYNQAVALSKRIGKLYESGKKAQVKLPIEACVISYSPAVTKVKVVIFHHGNSSMVIEYWGNAEFKWVKANIEMNIASILDANK